MESNLNMFANYLYHSNKNKMILAHLLELGITANKIVSPLFIFSLLQQWNKKNLSNSTLVYSLLGLVLNAVLPSFRDLLISYVRNDVQKNITLDMVKSVYARELDTLLGAPTGSCAVVTSKNYGSVGNVTPTFFSEVLPVILETLGISSALTYRYGKVGLFPTAILGAYLALASYREKKSTAVKEQNSALMRQGFGALLNAINNYQIAHQYGNTQHELDKLNTELTKLENSYNEVQKNGEKSTFLLSMLSHLGVAGAAAYAFLRSGEEKLKLEDFMMLGYYLFRFSSLLNVLPAKMNTLYTGLIDTQLVVNFLNAKSNIPEPELPLPFKLSNPPSIEFKNVNFGYANSGQGLEDISFSIKPGQKIAIMGATGSGKSTILKLIQRFYDFKGQILINDIDIKKILKTDLRNCLSVVSQETGLMEDTLYKNIQYGDLQANESDIFAAANYAGLKFDRNRFFNSVHQQGANFSGGEKQRINIARALLKKNAYLFLLDEPTSALDQETAQGVLKTLDQLTNVATMLIVTHDPYVAVNADYILYLDQGKIIEKGTFETLMSQKSAFYKQVLVQCEKMGISPDDIKPINKQTDEQVHEFVEWRNQRNMARL